MVKTVKLIRQIEAGEYDRAFALLYGDDEIEVQRARYVEAAQAFGSLFGMDRDIYFFSAPGRIEIGGNHTDHNHGRVLAASVNLDVIGVASPSPESRVRIQSKGFPMDTVELGDLSVHEADRNTSAALIRGLADRFAQNGWRIGGFDAYTTSNVLVGSGLSSSAAFEVLVGVILSHLFNNGGVDAVEIAKMAQYAENVHCGKPSGLMDQTTSSVGGIITIDFVDSSAPVIRRVNYDFSGSGYKLCIVDTGGSHADLTLEYAAIPSEMKAVASSLGVSVLRETSMEMLMENLPALRAKLGDRAVLRAIHFLRENERARQQVAALESGDFGEFRRLVVESGHSSFEYLQNVYASSYLQEQGLSLALCLAQGLLEERGAWRVHGGGFAGTTLNFVPEDLLDEFLREMECAFGKGSCHVLTIRPFGGVCLNALNTPTNA